MRVTATRPHTPRLTATLREKESVTPLELFFDLVFVLALTQCTALMAKEPTWEGLAKAMLILAVLWWSWGGYAWLTSLVDPEEGIVRIAMFGAMAAFLVAALCVPEAFDETALLFAVAYAGVRAAHIVLFAIGSRGDANLRASVTSLAVSTAIGVGLLVGASFADGLTQGAIWAVAILLDYSGPAFFGVEGWKMVPSHFAERFGLIVIIALGESIVAIGVGSDSEVNAGVVAGAVLGVVVCGALWWLYFDVVALVAERRFERQRRAANATRSAATPTATCTCRWSRGSCCWRWASRRRWATSARRSSSCRRRRCSAALRCTSSRTSRSGCAMSIASASSACCARSRWWRSSRRRSSCPRWPRSASWPRCWWC